MTSTDRSWLANLRALAPIPATFWHPQIDWPTADPRGVVPPDAREVLEIYGEYQFDVDPADPALADVQTRLVGLELPEDGWDGGTPRPSTTWSATTEHRIVGVSRSADPAWAVLPLPEQVHEQLEWLRIHVNDRVGNALGWPPPVDAERRVTLVASTQRPELWVLAMPAAEVMARTLTGRTGCPWLDLPAPRIGDDGTVASFAVTYRYDEPPEGYDDRIWARGVPEDPRAPEPWDEFTVEVLVPDALPGAPLLDPSREQAATALRHLEDLVPPPAEPRKPPTWDDVAVALGGPVRQDLIDLIERYGRAELSSDDPDADFPTEITIAPPMPGAVEPLEDWVREGYDFTDVVGEDDPADLHAVEWAVTYNSERQLWAWRLGERHGLFVLDEYTATRLSGSAAEIVLDALHHRGSFSDLDSDARLALHPITYKPF